MWWSVVAYFLIFLTQKSKFSHITDPCKLLLDSFLVLIFSVDMLIGRQYNTFMQVIKHGELLDKKECFETMVSSLFELRWNDPLIETFNLHLHILSIYLISHYV